MITQKEIEKEARKQILINKEIERLEDLERVRYNEIYKKFSIKLRKEHYWKWLFNGWAIVSKQALIEYERKYGEISELGDIKRYMFGKSNRSKEKK